MEIYHCDKSNNAEAIHECKRQQILLNENNELITQIAFFS